MIYGPVAEAARGGHVNPIFDIAIGSFAIVLIWIKPTGRSVDGKVNIPVALACTAVAASFIASGLLTLLH